ncbi:MAG TPA: hypothetical protein VFB46_04745 [Gemmatimonadaceae bacterium]|nr:hypothetical protein [Gemmatimonadaceae bacterium]
MRPFALATLAAAALSACATAPRVESATPAPEPPLRVWIGFPVGSARIHPIYVNREAHVAMFEIIPNVGATLVYPRYGAHASASVTHFADLTIQPGRSYYRSNPFGYAAFTPRYYYVIASTQPLRVASLYRSPGLLRRQLGATYASYDAYEVIDRVTQLILPMQADEDWATDLFIDWPTPPAATRRAFAYRFVRCANGRVFPVLGDYPYFGCPGDARVAVAPDSGKKPVMVIPGEPKRPRGRDRIEIVEPRGTDVEGRRRATGSEQAPRAGRGTSRPPSSEGIRYSDDRRANGATAEPARTSSPPRAEPVRDAERAAPAQRSDPPREPAPRGGSSGERKPDPR